MNILFVCSRNQWRSPTAEAVFRQRCPQHQFRSAGTANSARRKINHKDIAWADTIFVMEHEHRKIIKQRFDNDLRNHQRGISVYTLNIPDDYECMDSRLVELLVNHEALQCLFDNEE